MKVLIIDDEDRARKSIAGILKLSNNNIKLAGSTGFKI